MGFGPVIADSRPGMKSFVTVTLITLSLGLAMSTCTKSPVNPSTTLSKGTVEAGQLGTGDGGGGAGSLIIPITYKRICP